ncbi:hypothetical protein [Sphingomonas sp. IW22]|uniref:hypothetical protein n=1 Tax=Sphingomonas sp. IW22 TaxID=3242489 RepID=UPI00351FE99E
MTDEDRAAAVAAVKALVRSTSAAEDALIATLVCEAMDLAERFTGQVLIARDVTERIGADGRWRRLTTTPVLRIDGVRDAAGVAMPVGQWAVDIDGNGDGWVRVTGAPRVVAVSMRAGLAPDWATLPGGIAGGIVRMAAYRFDARDTGEVPPAAVAALWRPWRRMRLSEGMRA